MKEHETALEVAPLVYQLLFMGAGKLPADVQARINIQRGAHGKVKYLDLGSYRFVTQNPDKPSLYGQLARQGHKILWVIYQPTNQWLARVYDGELQKL